MNYGQLRESIIHSVGNGGRDGADVHDDLSGQYSRNEVRQQLAWMLAGGELLLDEHLRLWRPGQGAGRVAR